MRVLKADRGDKKAVFYLGIPAHSNLGDLAQGICIRRWIKKHYPERHTYEIETDSLVNTSFPVLKTLKNTYRDGDIIVFQSGYTTTDLGGFADEMHRAVMKALPDAPMLMMPQTIFFQKKENEKRTSEEYNKMKNMLYLARDEVSFAKAKEMFPDIALGLYPDIVTTLIGNQKVNTDRNGILFCLRNDGEKFYSDEELSVLEEKCREISDISRTDTTKKGVISEIVANAEKYIYDEINCYSKYKIIITDRYHGTILSLAAGTPVIIIKTTDHKVTTGALWFKGVYDGYVHLASSLDDAFEIAKDILSKDYDYTLSPYFEREYYDKLKNTFENTGVEK